MAKAKKPADQNFEALLQRLEAVLDSLEHGDLLDVIRESLGLTDFADDAEEARVRGLVSQLGGTVAQ